MTEEEWLRCEEPEALLSVLFPDASVRKARLLIVGCCRRLASFLKPDMHPVRDDLLAMMECCADDPLPDNWSDAIWGDWELVQKYDRVDGCDEVFECYLMVINTGLAGGLMTAAYAAEENGAKSEGGKQAALLREIFGNPFRPIAPDPAWLTSNVVELARAIYDERAFDRLPILADALMDEGCDSEAILSHCRSPGPHVRGCWVVDLLLGKE